MTITEEANRILHIASLDGRPFHDQESWALDFCNGMAQLCTYPEYNDTPERWLKIKEEIRLIMKSNKNE